MVRVQGPAAEPLGAGVPGCTLPARQAVALVVQAEGRADDVDRLAEALVLDRDDGALRRARVLDDLVLGRWRGRLGSGRLDGPGDTPLGRD